MSRGLLAGGSTVLSRLILSVFAIILVSLVVRVQYNETVELRRQVEQLSAVSRNLQQRLGRDTKVQLPTSTKETLTPPPAKGAAATAALLSTTVTGSPPPKFLSQAAEDPSLHRPALSSTSSSSFSTIHDELQEAALQHLYYSRGEGRLFRSQFESRTRSQCILLICNERGLAVRIPNVTEGCECVCTGGWSGAACQVPPPGSTMSTSPTDLLPLHDVAPPQVVIPLDREDVPAPPVDIAHDVLNACRAASIAYFNEHSPKGEFRSDRAVDHLWKIASELVPPYCSTDKERIAIVDIGAHVGTKSSLWADLILAGGREHRCTPGEPIADDSVVLLVEPNPLNLLSLRRRVNEVSELATSSTRNVNTTARNNTSAPSPQPQHGYRHPHGSIIIAEVAVAHYDGDGVMMIDLAANRNKKRDGNERGYLRLPHVGLNTTSGGSSSVTRRRNAPATSVMMRHVRTSVRTVASLLRDALLIGSTRSARPITTVSILKIDAEGLDPLVLYGAHEILPITRLVVFECHKLWRERGGAPSGAPDDGSWWRLKEVLEYLAKHGLDTYLVGQFFWIPMTPPHYWADVYEEQLGWSNCVALRKGHPIMKAFSVPSPCTVG
ncbi:methyltransferase, putative [Bodo saltans]|uniref:Methyltransferase, putative n=1 Tax=Bodo saltans TaxID=75058 RepID=A0A0S4IKU0_BODSA|nr:methyltransferase, putative [Bodo saltans]|eukprot:CUE69016.1 methyltransferase, putative [Bodo saltans]